MKRQGDNSQLSREEYDNLDDEDTEAGVYKKASAEKMATRRIVKRGQKFANLGNQNVAPLNASKPSSAFSSQGSKPENAPKTGNVFGSIALAANSTSALPKAGNVFGSVNLAAGNAIPLGIIKTPSSSATTAKNNPPSTATTSSSNAPQSKMQRLNKSFMSWMDKQMVNHSVSNWSAGLQDYLKHASKIAEALTDGKDDSAEEKPSSLGSFQTAKSTVSEAKTTSAAPKFGGFGQPASSTTGSNGGSKGTTFGGFSATTATTSAPAAKPAAFAGFGGSTTTTSAGNSFAPGGFGATATSKTNVPLATSGFGAASTTTGTFGAGTGTGAGTGAGAGSDDYEGEPILEPEKIYKNENDLDEILYETDCKAFRFDTTEKEWKESGKGSLRMTQEPGVDKKKILVRNTLGKITINAYIFKGMKIKQAGKSGLQFMAVVDASGVPQSFLVKVKGSEIQTALEKFTTAENEAK